MKYVLPFALVAVIGFAGGYAANPTITSLYIDLTYGEIDGEEKCAGMGQSYIYISGPDFKKSMCYVVVD